MAELSLPMPEVRGSNPVIGEVIIKSIYLLSTIWKRRKFKEAHLKKVIQMLNTLR